MKLNSLEAARLPLPLSSSKEERGKEGGIRFPSSPLATRFSTAYLFPESLHFAPRYYVKQIKQQIRNEIKPGLPCNFIHIKLGPNRRRFSNQLFLHSFRNIRLENENRFEILIRSERGNLE